MNGETTDHNEVHIDTISGGNEKGQENSLFSVIRDDIDPNLVQTTDGNDHDNKDDHDGGVMNSKQAELSEHELLRMKEKKDQKPTNNDKNTEEWDEEEEKEGEEEKRSVDSDIGNGNVIMISNEALNISNNSNEENHGNALSELQVNEGNQRDHVHVTAINSDGIDTTVVYADTKTTEIHNHDDDDNDDNNHIKKDHDDNRKIENVVDMDDIYDIDVTSGTEGMKNDDIGQMKVVHSLSSLSYSQEEAHREQDDDNDDKDNTHNTEEESFVDINPMHTSRIQVSNGDGSGDTGEISLRTYNSPQKSSRHSSPQIKQSLSSSSSSSSSSVLLSSSPLSSPQSSPFRKSSIYASRGSGSSENSANRSTDTNMNRKMDTSTPWTQYFTPEGWPYYYNSKTGESSWEAPTQAANANDDDNDSRQAVLNEGREFLKSSRQEDNDHNNDEEPTVEFSDVYRSSVSKHHDDNKDDDDDDDDNNHDVISEVIKANIVENDHKSPLATNVQILPSSSSSSSAAAATVDQVTSGGQSALHVTATTANVNALTLLLQSGASSANQRDAYDKTALHVLAENASSLSSLSCIECIDVLLKYGCDINSVDIYGKTVIHYCTLNENSVLLQAIANICKDLNISLDCSKEDKDGNTPLVLSAKMNNLECMQILIAAATRNDELMNVDNHGVSNYNGKQQQQRHKRIMNTPSSSSLARVNGNKFNNFNITTGRHVNKKDKNGNKSSKSMVNAGSKVIESISVSSLSEEEDDELMFQDASDYEHLGGTERRQHSTSKYSRSRKLIGKRLNDNNDNNNDNNNAPENLKRSPRNHWVECSTNDGKLYYYNNVTQTVQWENPFSSQQRHGSDNTINSKRQVVGKRGGNMAHVAGGQVPSMSNSMHTRTQGLYNILSPQASVTSQLPRNQQQQQQSSSSSVHHSYDYVSSSSVSHASSSNMSRSRSSPTMKISHHHGKDSNVGGRSPSSANRSIERGKKLMEGYRNSNDNDDNDNSFNEYRQPQQRRSNSKMRTSATIGTSSSSSSLHYRHSSYSLTSDSSFTDDNDDGAHMKERHLTVWNRFFENALKAKESRKQRQMSELLTSDENNGNNTTIPLLNRSMKGIWPPPISYDEYDTLFKKTKIRIENIIINNNNDDGEMMMTRTPDRKTMVLLNTSLLAASQLGEGSDLEYLLSRGANAQCVDEQIRTPIHYACKIIDFKSVTVLADYGGDLDAKDLSGVTPLHISAETTGGYDIMKFLLESAVDVNCEVTASGNTPLHLAARKGDVKCCELLLQYGALKDAVNSQQQTPLDVATQAAQRRGVNNVAVIKCLSAQYNDNHNNVHVNGINTVNEDSDDGDDIFYNTQTHHDVLQKQSPTTDHTYSSNEGSNISNKPRPLFASSSSPSSLSPKTRMIKTSSGKALANLRVDVHKEPVQSSSSSNIWESKTDQGDNDDDDDDFDTRSITSQELKNILLHENENDREERERKAIIESTTLTSLVSDAMWVSGSWMLGKTASVFSSAASMVKSPFKKSTSSRSLSSSSSSSSLSMYDDNDNNNSLPLAPPTDFELSQKGMGFVSDSGKFHRYHSTKSGGNHSHETGTSSSSSLSSEPEVTDALASLMTPPTRYISSSTHTTAAMLSSPPTSVAHELHAHVEAMKLGLTPKNQPKPPVPSEVTLAIMKAKSNDSTTAQMASHHNQLQQQKSVHQTNANNDDNNVEDVGATTYTTHVHDRISFDNDTQYHGDLA